MRGMLEELGYIGALIARDTPHGLQLLDGHLRKDVTADSEVPVLIVDLNDEEAKKALLTFDPLGDLATFDPHALDELMKIDMGGALTDNADLRKMLVDMSEQLHRDEDNETPEQRDMEVPGMALSPHEHYDYLVVLARTSHEWNVVCDKLGLVPMVRRGKLGTCRAITAGALLDALLKAAGK